MNKLLFQYWSYILTLKFLGYYPSSFRHFKNIYCQSLKVQLIKVFIELLWCIAFLTIDSNLNICINHYWFKKTGLFVYKPLIGFCVCYRWFFKSLNQSLNSTLQLAFWDWFPVTTGKPWDSDFSLSFLLRVPKLLNCHGHFMTWK